MDQPPILVATCVLVASLCVASSSVAGDRTDPVAVQVLESGAERILLQFEVGEYNQTEVAIEGTPYVLPRIPGESHILEAGTPDLPRICRSVIIPDDARMEIDVLSAEYDEYPGVRIAPSKGPIERSIDPGEVPYTFGAPYSENRFYPAEIVQARSPYILRDYRGLVVVVHPFAYNPVTEVLRVYSRVVVELRAAGPGEVNVLTDHHRDEMSGEFAAVYREHFLNFREFRYSPVSESGEMLVITFDAYRDEVEPLVDWKNQMGLKTTLVNVSSIGNDSTSILSYVQGFYDSTNLTFLLLVGDGAQIAFPMAYDGAADPLYSLLAGDDMYPDIFVGRFSAQSGEEVETQVERTIAYERDPMVGAAWYHKATGIASDRGPGDDDELDYEHVENIRADLLGYNYTVVDPIYDPGAAATQVTTAINSGRGFVNYTGHGSTTAWGTTGFSMSHVNTLINVGKLPFIFDVACLNGKFNGGTCFAETWLRATDGGNPTGAVGMYASSITQYWDPPMCAQDEATDLLVAEERRTFGGLCFSGSCQMIDEYDIHGEKMFSCWHIFGDPSLQVRTDTPAPLTVIHDSTIDRTAATFEVCVAGVEGALCALSYQGTYLGSAYTGADGIARIPVAGTIHVAENLAITATSWNGVPYLGSTEVVAHPVIDVSPLSFEANLAPGATRTFPLEIGNIGEPGSVLSFVIDVVESDPLTKTLSINGSSMGAGTTEYEPGATMDIPFAIAASSPDGEYMKYAALDFPTGVTVNSSTDFVVVGQTRKLLTDGTTGDGAEIQWSAPGYWGEIRNGEIAVCTVQVTIDPGFLTDMELPWTLEGDGWGGTPHEVSGTIVLSPSGPTFLVCSPNGGERWEAGRDYSLLWASSGMSDSVRLFYSYDNGGSWDTISAATEDDGQHLWTVPETPSAHCFFKVSSLDGASNDVSDGAFTIYEPIRWLSADPDEGTVDDGDVRTVDILLDAGEAPSGDHLASIVITSDGGAPVVVTVDLSVSAVPVDPGLSTVASNTDLLLSPDGDGDSTLLITVTARDPEGNPIPGIPPEDIVVTAVGVSHNGESMHFCSSGLPQATFVPASPTDSAGSCTIAVAEVGGCGSITITAEIQGIALSGNAVSEVRSPDLSGDGAVNFTDTFLFVSYLSATTGYCGNLSGDPGGRVDFWDTIKFLPFLSGAAACP